MACWNDARELQLPARAFRARVQLLSYSDGTVRIRRAKTSRFNTLDCLGSANAVSTEVRMRTSLCRNCSYISIGYDLYVHFAS